MIAYKYRNDGLRSLDIIRSRKIYFPLAKQLNDPLDSQIDIDQEYMRVVELYRPSHSEEYLRKSFCKHMLNQHEFFDKRGRNVGLNGAMQWFISQLGIFPYQRVPLMPFCGHIMVEHTLDFAWSLTPTL